MEKCLVIINKNAGKCSHCTTEKVSAALGGKLECDTIYLPCDEINFSGYRHIAVCGGDGTLSSILSMLAHLPKTIYYFPCGTLNDKAKAKRYGEASDASQAIVGKSNDDFFTYVYAAGAFTPIGYIAKIERKKQFGIFAYVLKIIEAYKVNRISASINVGDSCYQGEFNLLMIIKSPRCFGLNFNKAYKDGEQCGHLVAIRSPKHNGLLGKIEMFFPFFRVFFMGMKNEREGKIIFRKVETMTIDLDAMTSFCVDGEQKFAQGSVDIHFEKTNCKLKIMECSKNGTPRCP